MGKKYPYLKTQHTPKLLRLSNLHVNAETRKFLWCLETKTYEEWDEFSTSFDDFSESCYIDLHMLFPERDIRRMEEDEDIPKDFLSILQFAVEHNFQYILIDNYKRFDGLSYCRAPINHPSLPLYGKNDEQIGYKKAMQLYRKLNK